MNDLELGRLDLAPRTLAAEPGGIMKLSTADGRELTPADRETMLRELRAGGGPMRLTMDALVFEQLDTPNRNFVRFKAGVLRGLGKSFTGAPFLADHDQGDVTKRGGTIVASAYDGLEGIGKIRQTVELVKPWAIEGALDGTLDRFSIGWMNTAPVVCSECDAPMFPGFFGVYPTCEHYPGDVVETKDGGKRFVEMVVTGAQGIETSAVNVPAVEGTGVEEIRAALSAARKATATARKPTPPRLAARVTEEGNVKAIAKKLGLAEDAGEVEILAAVGSLTLERDGERAAHAATRARLGEVEAELAAGRKVETEKRIAAALAVVETKLGKGELSADACAIVRQLAEVSIDKAEAWAARLAHANPLTKPPIAGRDPSPPAGGALTANEKSVLAQLGVTEEQFRKSNPDR